MSVVDTWHHCAKLLRQFMKGWGANLGRDIQEKKAIILAAIQVLDIRVDGGGLSPDEWLHRYALEDELVEIFRN